MKNREKVRRYDEPQSLKELDEGAYKAPQNFELEKFPPPPDIDELKRILSEDRNISSKLRKIGWISS